jgi:hypothetical protein
MVKIMEKLLKDNFPLTIKKGRVQGSSLITKVIYMLFIYFLFFIIFSYKDWLRTAGNKQKVKLSEECEKVYKLNELEECVNIVEQDLGWGMFWEGTFNPCGCALPLVVRTLLAAAWTEVCIFVYFIINFSNLAFQFIFNKIG